MKVLISVLAVLFLAEVQATCTFNQANARLYCDNTSLDEIRGFKQNDAVRELQVANSNIHELPNNALPFPNVRKVSIQCKLKKLNSASFNNLVKLVELDLSNNEIELIPNDIFEELQFLDTLSLRHNHLRNPTLDTFYGLNKLISLDISYNRITFIMLGALDEMKQLRTLDISHNALVDMQLGLFDQLKRLEHLNLSDNLLNGFLLGIFDELEHLTTLNLSGNRIVFMPLGLFDRSPKISNLDLSRNNLTEIPLGMFDSLKNTKVLSLAGNKLNNLINGVFDQMKNLTTLDISSNNLPSITLGTFSSLGELKHLNLSHNNLETLSTKMFQGQMLETIDLSYNKLTTVQPDLLNHETLREIRLSNNKISILEIDTFASCLFPIEYIDVRNNNLMYIQPEFFDWVASLKQFEIGGNPWHCPCLKNLVKIMNERYISYTKDYYFDGQRPSCVASDSEVCEYKVLDRTDFENALKHYQ